MKRLGGPEWFVVSGSAVFIFILWLSAYFEADIRWLHFFQAWMYVATVWLTLHRNRWGYFIGIAVAGLWSYVNLFVNTFLRGGLEVLTTWIRTGHLAHPDRLISIPAWLGNVAIVAGCLWGYFRLADRPAKDWLRFSVTFAVTTGFFLLDVAVFQPRYLALFRELFRPHSPW